jgi:hypothetical protein
MIGDKLSDILRGSKACYKTIYINRNYREKKLITQITSVKNLKEATNSIISNLLT